MKLINDPEFLILLILLVLTAMVALFGLLFLPGGLL